MIERDKVESRTDAEQLRQKIYDRWKKARQDFGQASWQSFVLKDIEEFLAARPSLPQQGQAQLVTQLVTALEAMLVMMDRGGQPRKLDEALTWRDNDDLARKLAMAALAASRSEEATPQSVNVEKCVDLFLEWLGDATISSAEKAKPHIVEYVTRKLGAPAAGSSERWNEGFELPEGESVLAEIEYLDHGKLAKEFVVCKLDEDSEDGLLTDCGDDVGWPTSAIVRWQKITPALAGTDTDVAKENL